MRACGISRTDCPGYTDGATGGPVNGDETKPEPTDEVTQVMGNVLSDKMKDRLIIALISVIVGAVGGGGMSLGVGATDDYAESAEVAKLRGEVSDIRLHLTAHEATEAESLKGIEKTVGDIYTIVDKAHPRQ